MCKSSAFLLLFFNHRRGISVQGTFSFRPSSARTMSSASVRSVMAVSGYAVRSASRSNQNVSSTHSVRLN